MEQEQLYAAVIVIGVIFSILTNVALYYYGEAKDLKRKVNKGEYLYVRGEDWIERQHIAELKKRMTQLENRQDNLAEVEFNNRMKTSNEIFLMKQDVDLIKFVKGINKENIAHNFEEIKKNIIEIKTRLNLIESDEDIVRKEFLYGKLRDTDRRIVKVEDELKKWMGVSDDKA